MSTDDLCKLWQRICGVHEAAGRILQHLVRRQLMSSGAFYVEKRRCGKPNYRCTQGQLHTARLISRSQDGATGTFRVPAQQRARLRQLSREYRRYHGARALVAKRYGQNRDAG